MAGGKPAAQGARRRQAEGGADDLLMAARSSMVKMVLGDVGTGSAAERQATMTRGRQMLATNRRAKVAEEKDADLKDLKGSARADVEAAARSRRLLTMRVEREKKDLEDRLRTIWAQKLVKRAWTKYKLRQEEERKAKERQKRKEAADRQRQMASLKAASDADKAAADSLLQDHDPLAD
mmetsp:Transcript_1904/g.4460  ORF Transcript_1904/g.4460 Transcript_1904/m.4460 type:complete len:179 (-) Transcript_1904:93-629(-)